MGLGYRCKLLDACGGRKYWHHSYEFLVVGAIAPMKSVPMFESGLAELNKFSCHLFQLTAIQPASHSSLLQVISDVVINASPSSPPLSVFILYQMLAQQQHVLMHSFVHSSVRNSAVPDVNAVFNCPVAPVADRSHFQLGLSIIWKDGT